MKFSRSVVVIAWTLMEFSAKAQTAATQAAPVVNSAPVAAVQTTTSTTTTAAAEQVAPAAKVESQVQPAPAPAPSKTEEESRAEEIRKSRQAVEHKNDDKIVEKLEKARLDEEKNRTDKINNTNLDANQPAPTLAPAAPTTTIIVTPAPAAPEQKAEKVEVAAPVAVQQPTPEDAQEKEVKKSPKFYAGAGIGAVQYGNNVQNQSSYGLMVGALVDERIMIEAGLGISKFSLNNEWTNPLFGSMNQYDLSVAAKYVLIPDSRFRPYVGAGFDYIMRSYQNRYSNSVYYSYDNYTTQQNTNSADLALILGADFMLTEQFALGGEFHYNFNVYGQNNGVTGNSSIVGNTKPLEQSSFTNFLVSAKFFF